MFIRKVLGLAGLNGGRKVAENGMFSAYNTLYNKVEVTEFYYKNEAAFKAAAVLRDVKHLNVLRSIKVVQKSRKIVTEQVQPFASVFRAKDREFNMHCAYSLASAISFLHEECKIAHNNICLDALFITNNLNFVLGSFERSSREESFQRDTDGFQALLSAFSLPRRLVSDVLEDKAWHSEFLGGLEAFMHEFSTLKLCEKKERVRNLASNAKILGPFFREKISEKLTLELKILKEKEGHGGGSAMLYKEAVAKMALELDTHKDRVLNELFVILDPALRIFLLKNIAASSVSSLGDKAMECMLAGTRCRDQTIQALTVSLISRGYDKLSTKQKATFIRSARLLASKAMLGKVCSILLRHVDSAPQVTKEVCKLIELFLPVEEMCLEVLPLMGIYYRGFSYEEICRKIIVVLFELVRHSRSQDPAFEAIDLLVGHLKMNKSHIIEKEWRTCVKAFFSHKKNKSDATGITENPLELETVLEKKNGGKDESRCKTSNAGEDGWSDDW